MNREDNEERKNCERMLERLTVGVLSRFVPYMNVNVKISMLGRDDYKLRISRQTTLHEYGDIGVSPTNDENYHYLDVSLNKTILTNPNIGDIMVRLIDDLEEKVDYLRQTE